MKYNSRFYGRIEKVRKNDSLNESVDKLLHGSEKNISAFSKRQRAFPQKLETKILEVIVEEDPRQSTRELANKLSIN